MQLFDLANGKPKSKRNVDNLRFCCSQEPFLIPNSWSKVKHLAFIISRLLSHATRAIWAHSYFQLNNSIFWRNIHNKCSKFVQMFNCSAPVWPLGQQCGERVRILWIRVIIWRKSNNGDDCHRRFWVQTWEGGLLHTQWLRTNSASYEIRSEFPPWLGNPPTQQKVGAISV